MAPPLQITRFNSAYNVWTQDAGVQCSFGRAGAGSAAPLHQAWLLLAFSVLWIVATNSNTQYVT